MESSLEREGFEIFSDNDTLHNPESNKTFLRPLGGKLPVETWGLGGSS